MSIVDPIAYRLRRRTGAALLALAASGLAFLPAPRAAAPVAGLAGLAAAGAAAAQELSLSGQELTPETFRPVCPASDGLYGFGKAAADGLLGSEGAEYRPLAIEALLRVRRYRATTIEELQ